jgi:hypothetical protein
MHYTVSLLSTLPSFQCGFYLGQLKQNKQITAGKGETLDRGCIQKFPDRVHNDIYAYNNTHALRSSTRVMEAKLTRLTHEIAI